MNPAALPIVASFVVVGIISQFYRSAIAVIAPDLAAELALSPEELGIVGGAFFIGIAAMQVPVGVLLDRFGPRRTTPVLLILAVAGSVLFARADGFFELVAGQVLVGMGCAGVLMGALVTVSRWFPPKRFVMVGAAIMAISGAGLLLSATPLAWAADGVGWRNAFLAVAAATAVFGAVVFAFARDAPPGHDYHRRPRENLGAVIAGLREVLGHRDILFVLALSFVAYGTVFAIRGLWGGPYLADVHGLGSVARGNVLLFMSMGTIAGSLLYGLLESRLGGPRPLALGGAASSALVLAVLALAPRLPMPAVTALFTLLAFGGAYTVLLIAHGRALFPDRLVGRAMTMVNFANFVGIGMIQIVSGVIVGAFPPGADGAAPEAAYRAVFGFIAVLVLVTAVLYSRTRGTRREG